MVLASAGNPDRLRALHAVPAHQDTVEFTMLRHAASAYPHPPVRPAACDNLSVQRMFPSVSRARGMHGWCVAGKSSSAAPFAAAGRHPGFTLIEILIVMAVLAAMAAFTVPAMRGGLDKSRLRAAGRDVSAALSQARALAIREGVAMQFTFRPGGTEWQIQRTGLPPMQSRQQASAESSLSGSSVSSNATAAEGFNASQMNGGSVVRAGQLPAGIFFQPDDLEDPFSSDVLPTSQDSSAFALTESGDQWSAPITFRPNGRSEDAELVLNGARRFSVRVRLRGLTSAVRYSPPYRSADSNSLLAGADANDSESRVAEAAR